MSRSGALSVGSSVDTFILATWKDPNNTGFSTLIDDDRQLYIGIGGDGVNWTSIGPVYASPTGWMTDPSIIYRNGFFYVCHTSGAEPISGVKQVGAAGEGDAFNIAHSTFRIIKSRDLVNWTAVATPDLNTLGLTGIVRAWAPQFFVEDNGDVYVLITTSTAGVAGPFSTQIIKATATDLTTFGTATTLSGGPTSKVDATVVKDQGVYHLFVKNDSGQWVEHWTSSALAGTYASVATGNALGFGADREGPSLVQLSDGTWRMYMDWFDALGGLQTATAPTLNGTWTTPAFPNLPGKGRHGDVIRLTSQVASNIAASALSMGADIDTSWQYVNQAGMPAFSAGWSNYGNPFSPLAYRRRRGYVEIRGTIKKSSAGVNGETIFTLPAGYRPTGPPSGGATTLLTFPTCGATADVAARVDVSTTGLVKWAYGPPTTYFTIAAVFSVD